LITALITLQFLSSIDQKANQILYRELKELMSGHGFLSLTIQALEDVESDQLSQLFNTSLKLNKFLAELIELAVEKGIILSINDKKTDDLLDKKLAEIQSEKDFYNLVGVAVLHLLNKLSLKFNQLRF